MGEESLFSTYEFTRRFQSERSGFTSKERLLRSVQQIGRRMAPSRKRAFTHPIVGLCAAVVLGSCGSAAANGAKTTSAAAPSKSTANQPAASSTANTSMHGLWVSDLNAGTVSNFGFPPAAPPSITVHNQACAQPESLAFDRSGNLWIGCGSSGSTTPKIEEYSPGDLVNSSPPGHVLDRLGQVISPEGLALDSHGDLWVAGGTVVAEYAAGALNANTLPTMTISTPSFIDGPDSVAFDRSGNLWVANYNNRVIVEYSRSSLTSGTPRPAGHVQMAAGASPFALAFAPNGDLWVVAKNDMVYEFAASTLGTTNVPSSTINMSAYISGGGDGLAFDSSGNLWVSVAGASTSSGVPAGMVYEFAASTLGTTNVPSANLIASSTSNPGTWAIAFFPVSGSLGLQ